MQTIEEDAIARKFRLGNAPTLIARRESGFPIGFSRLCSDQNGIHRTLSTASEEAFSFFVALRPMSKGGLTVDGKYRLIAPVTQGETILYDLRKDLIGEFTAPFDYMRFYLPMRTLDQLCHEEGMRPLQGLRMPFERAMDPVMFGFAHTLSAALDAPHSVPALFVDSLAVALHAHVAGTYGVVAEGVIELGRSSLSLRQLRVAQGFIEANLTGDPTIADLARECDLSPSYFARAFRQTTGMPPYRWVMKQRVERAKELISKGEMELVEVALACGFADQSHLNRTFMRFAGSTPGQWRKALEEPAEVAAA